MLQLDYFGSLNRVENKFPFSLDGFYCKHITMIVKYCRFVDIYNFGDINARLEKRVLNLIYCTVNNNYGPTFVPLLLVGSF